MDGSILEEKSFFKVLGLTFSWNLIGALILSLLLKIPPRKLEPWFILRSFFLIRLLCISINLPYSHAWNGCMAVVMFGDPSCYLKLLGELEKWIYRTVGPSLGTCIESLAHCCNVASLSLFYWYYFGRCSSELAQLVPLPFSQERSTRYSDRVHDFSVTIPWCYKDFYVSSSLPDTARPWNSVPIECFHLTYEKWFNWKWFIVCFNLFALLFLVTL